MTGPNNLTATRRRFLETSSALAAATSLGFVTNAHAAGDDVIKVGLIGCGGRGSGAAEQAVTSSPNVKLHARGDMFKDHLDSCRKSLKDHHSELVDVPDDRCFTGFDAYKKVIDSGVDLVILATPPGF